MFAPMGLLRKFALRLLLAAQPLIAFSTASADDAVGRYEMVALPPLPGSFESRVMILDTRDGHLWQWWQTPSVANGTPSAGITYLGKVTAGTSAGDVRPTRRGEMLESGAPPRNRP